ncbi:MAG: hypothetical protein WA753_08230, partial [Pseudolabrys sp.]
SMDSAIWAAPGRATIPLTRSTCTMVVYNHFGSFITLSPKIARDLALRACGFFEKGGSDFAAGE